MKLHKNGSGSKKSARVDKEGLSRKTLYRITKTLNGMSINNDVPVKEDRCYHAGEGQFSDHSVIGVNIIERKSGIDRTKKRKQWELVFFPPPGGATGTVVHHLDATRIFPELR